MRQREFPSKYQLNESYFNIIDNANKAYFLGFLYADGYIDEGFDRKGNFKRRGQTLNLTLKLEDTYILELLRKDIQSEKPLMYIKSQDKYRLCICSKHLVSSLVKLGCGQAKTFTLKFPTEDQVPKHLLSHFIRGYFDGDGTIYFKEGVQYVTSVQSSFQIISTMQFVSSVGTLFKNLLDLNMYIRKANIKNKEQHVYRLQYGGRLSTVKILEFLYKDKGDMYLTRKYDKFLIVKNYLKKPAGKRRSKIELQDLKNRSKQPSCL